MRLNKKQSKEKSELHTKLTEAEEALKEAVEAFNTSLSEARDVLQTALDAYNEVRDKVNDFVTGMAEELRDSFDEKSERWQEGDAGQEADAFISEWENAEFGEEMNIAMPDDLDEPDFSPSADDLEALPEES